MRATLRPIIISSTVLTLSGCLDGPSLFKQDGSATDNYEMVTTATDGLVTGQYDPSSAATQIMGVTGGTIAGASVAFPPGALAIDTMITLEEGAGIANSAMASELSISGGLESAGSAVVISNSLQIDADEEFSMTIPRSQGSSLALASSDERLIVLFRIVKNGETFAGVIPNSELTISAGKITFKTRYFGSFQAALTEQEITKRIEKSSAAEILTSRVAEDLPPLKFIVGSSSSDAVEREIAWPVRVEGADELVRCSMFVFRNKTSLPFFMDSTRDRDDLDRIAGPGDESIFDVATDQALSVYVRFACTDVTGRQGESAFVPGHIDASPAEQTNFVSFTGWAAHQNPYSQRIWDTSTYPQSRVVAGLCKAGAGPVHIRVDGHDPAGNSQADVYCTAAGTFSVTVNTGPASYTGPVDLPGRIGGFGISASQGPAGFDKTIIFRNSGLTMYPIPDKATLLGINPSDTSRFYILTAPIDMEGTSTTFGDFSTFFDGDGHVIRNVSVPLADGTQFGFFSSMSSATVGHVVFHAPVVSGSGPMDAAQIGVLAGTASAAFVNDVQVIDGTIDLSSITIGTEAGSYGVGGVVGYSTSATMITGSSFDGHITAAFHAKVGGIVGYNAGDIFGGWVGQHSGMIIGAEYVGGVAGYNDVNSNIEGVLSRTAVRAHGRSGYAYVGGVVGSNLGGIRAVGSYSLVEQFVISQNYVGGLVGSNGPAGVIEASFVEATIKIAGNAHVGGIVGRYDGGAGPNVIAQTYANVLLDVGSSGSSCGGMFGSSTNGDLSSVADSWAIVNYKSGGGTGCGGFGGIIGSTIITDPIDSYWVSTSTGDYKPGGSTSHRIPDPADLLYRSTNPIYSNWTHPAWDLVDGEFPILHVLYQGPQGQQGLAIP